MAVSYEWDVECADQHGDINDHDHSAKLAPHAAIAKAGGQMSEGSNDLSLVLVRDVCDPDTGSVEEREWAYVVKGKLPEYFTDGVDAEGIKVPKRFHEELARVIRS